MVLDPHRLAQRPVSPTTGRRGLFAAAQASSWSIFARRKHGKRGELSLPPVACWGFLAQNTAVQRFRRLLPGVPVVGLPLERATGPPATEVSFCQGPGKMMIANLSKQDVGEIVALKGQGNFTQATDAVTGAPVGMSGNAVTLTVPADLYRAVLLMR